MAVFNRKQALVQTYAAKPSEELRSQIAQVNVEDRNLRNKAQELIAMASEELDLKVETNDKDYVFIHFILNNLPKGLIGLLLAVILSAAMSSTASELNALASTTALDLYKRNTKKSISDTQMVTITKWFTLGWGLLAIVIACVAYLADNLIQLVNIIGSIFYGNVLGIFLLGFFFKFIKGNAVFTSAIITQVVVFVLYFLNAFEIINLPYLWLNFVGCVLCIGTAMALQKNLR
jgi:Na+/proline symporter